MKGLYAARVTDRGIKEVFIEEELLELERINAATRANRQAEERATQQAKQAARRAAEAHWKRNERIVEAVAGTALACGVLSALVSIGAVAGWLAIALMSCIGTAAVGKIREVCNK